MRFFTRVPGLVEYPPNHQPWEYEVTPPVLRRIVHTTEGAGFDGVAIPEQIVLSPEDATVMGRRWPDCLTTIAFLAGATERLQFMSSVLILPLHHPIRLAKRVATLDELTEGRFELGVGVSIFPAEFERFGVAFHERGRIADEYLEALLELWSASTPRFEGRYVRFNSLIAEPKPRGGRPTIWVGGDSDAAIQRAARFGDGWMPWQTSLSALPARLDVLRAARSRVQATTTMQVAMPLALLEVGADHRPAEGMTGRPSGPNSTEEILARLDEMSSLGVTSTSVPTPTVSSVDEYLDWLTRFGESVITPWRNNG
jgi:probable F420-dependent oxidoreductase